MTPRRTAKDTRLALKNSRPTYELRNTVWKLLADQDPRALYQEGVNPEPNLSAIARHAGLSPTTLMKIKNGDQKLTLEVLACLTNFLVIHGWDRVEAQEALISPLRFASTRRRLVAV